MCFGERVRVLSSNLFAGFRGEGKTTPLLIAFLIASGFFFVLEFISPLIVLFPLHSDAIAREFYSNTDYWNPLSLYSLLTKRGISPSITWEIYTIIYIVGLIICTMALWFAPMLVFMHDIAPFQALRMSLSACSKNILLVLAAIIYFETVMLTDISGNLFFLGLFSAILACFMCICIYTSYRDIFFDEKN